MNLKKLLTRFLPKPKEAKVEAKQPAIVDETEEDEVGEFIQAHPQPKDTYHRLRPEHKEFVCKLIGYGYKDNEIRTELISTFGIETSLTNLGRYHLTKKWAPAIKKYRDEYLASYDDIPGFHKKIRLDRMERAYEKAEKKGNIKEIISATEHQRKEIEGTGDTSLTLISNRYYNMTDEEIEKRQQEIMKLIEKEKRNGIRGIEGEVGEPGQDNGAKDV